MVPQIINTLDMAAMITNRADWYDGEGPIPDDLIDEMARELDLGRWIMRLALYGDESVVDHRYAKIKDAFERIPGAEVRGTKHDPEDVATLEQPAELVQAGVPEPRHQPHDRLVRRRGGRAHRLLAGRSDDRTRRAGPARPDARDHRAGGGARLHGRLLPINARSFIHVTMIMFDTKDEAQTARAYDVGQAVWWARRPSSATASTARTWTSWTWPPTSTSFGDHAYRRFCETIKDAVDPDGILAPGKQGIWPAAMRGGRAVRLLLRWAGYPKEQSRTWRARTQHGSG